MTKEPRHRINPLILERAKELRHPQTPAEANLWRHIRNNQLGYKFRRQHPIDRFIVDFYCAETRLWIEIDGPSHGEPEQMEYDRARTEYLKTLDYHLSRFTNDEVRYQLSSVLLEIVRRNDDLRDLSSKPG